MPEMRSVFSSHVNQIGYDAEKRELHVSFAKGRRREVVYHDIDERTARDVMEAPSIGEEMWRSIRGRFPHRHI